MSDDTPDRNASWKALDEATSAVLEDLVFDLACIAVESLSLLQRHVTRPLSQLLIRLAGDTHE